MVCVDIKECIKEFDCLADDIKNTCTGRLCTSDAVLNVLKTQGVILNEATLEALMLQIEGMIFFNKEPTYGFGDAVTYRHGLIFKAKKRCSLLVRINYKRFYLYHPERYGDLAFREHIQSKLDFEVRDRIDVDCGSDLKRALKALNIPKGNWFSYVYLKDEEVYRVGYDFESFHNTGRLLRRYKKETV